MITKDDLRKEAIRTVDEWSSSCENEPIANYDKLVDLVFNSLLLQDKTTRIAVAQAIEQLPHFSRFKYA